jgi:hypothetical protein
MSATAFAILVSIPLLSGLITYGLCAVLGTIVGLTIGLPLAIVGGYVAGSVAARY